MTEPQIAQGSTAEYCTKWPTEGHSMTTHMRGGALVSVSRCTGCGWIDFADLDEQVRAMQGGWARLERQAAQSGRPTDDLGHDLAALLNRHGRENASNTPDFILAEFMFRALKAGESLIDRRDRWYNINPSPGWRSGDKRDTPEAVRERALWSRDIARMLREQTGVAPHLRPGYLDAADWLDPADGTPVREDPAANAVAYRLGEQREALHAAREIFRALDVGNDSGLAFAIGAGTSTNITMWMDRFGKLADPPLTVEVEEDDDADDGPTMAEPGAGESSGRWQSLGVAGEDA